MLRLPPVRSLRAPVAVAAAAVVLAACSTPPWQQSAAGPSSGSPASSPSTSVSASSSSSTPSASSSITTVQNDLATGAAHHTATAGSIALKIDYWSTLDMGSWTPAANKPLTMAVSATLPKGTPGKQGVYLSRVTITPAVRAGDASAAAPATISDDASVSPGYTLRRPNSYQQVFTIPAIDPAATSLSLQVNLEMLLQTTPTSKQYAKQTASDTLTIALA